MILLSVDPGINHCGVAFFSPSRALVYARLARVRHASGDPPAVRVFDMASEVLSWLEPFPFDSWTVIFERPQLGVYGLARQKDLQLIAEVGASIAGRSKAPPVAYTPHEWKGSVDPDVMIGRIKSRLTPEEMSCVKLPAKSLQHNVFDAIGVGLHHLGRLDRKRVIAR